MLMPSLFISHGSPTVMIEEDSPGRAFLTSLGDQLPKPKAIVVVSAHWETQAPLVTGHPTPETIHDFYGFPPALYEKHYPVAGDPVLARRVADLVGGDIEDTRGLDHGAWSLLLLAYPQADIPVVQLSLQSDQGPDYHYDIGQRLAPLREDGVFVIGSGAVTHNLSTLKWYSNQPDAWAQTFEDWVVAALADNDHETLLAAPSQAPHFAKAHPSPEHWLPLYVALGAARDKATLLHRGFEHKNLSMASIRFD